MEHKTYSLNTFFNLTANVINGVTQFKKISQREAMLLTEKQKEQTLNTADRISLAKFERYVESFDKFTIDFGDYTNILAGFFLDSEELDTSVLSVSEFKEFHVSLQELIEVMGEIHYEFIFEDALYEAVMNDTLYEELDGSFVEITKMAHKIINSLLLGREFQTQNGKAYKVDMVKNKFSKRETIRFINLENNSELSCSTKAFVALIRNEVERTFTPQEIDSMIDVALDTRDFEWVNELLERKNKLTQSQ